jgi:hypothetical protein
MKKLSDATGSDFETLIQSTKTPGGSDTVAAAAQGFVDTLYREFQPSLVLLRLFSSLPYASLLPEDQKLVAKKCEAAGTGGLLTDATPVLTLLGTRGHRPEWNQRSQSEGFRCIPLVSSGYVGSLSMLSMQFRKMNLDLGTLDRWQEEVVAANRADQFKGMLYVEDAARDKDEQGRMVVPRQEFVAENGVKTALGFGAGYRNHPTIVTLFAFTNERLEEAAVRPFTTLLQNYLQGSEEALLRGRIF